MKTWIKICGNTNLVDSLAAAEAGADALGFLFAESPRRIEPEVARDIIQELPEPVEKIGVFVNESPEFVLQVARTAGLTGVQLHGEESTGYLTTLLSLAAPDEFKIIKSIQAELGCLRGLGPFAGGEEMVSALLVDSGSIKLRGGTGQVFNWVRASDFILGLQELAPVIIAGGLTPDNVSAAVGLFRPYGVDVVTGVEKEHGKKDNDKLKQFIYNVRSTEMNASDRKQ